MQTQDSHVVQTPQTALFPLSPECVRQLLCAKRSEQNRVLPVHAYAADDV